MPLRLSSKPPIWKLVLPLLPRERSRPVWLSTLAAVTASVVSLSTMPARLFRAPLRLKSMRLPAIWPSPLSRLSAGYADQALGVKHAIAIVETGGGDARVSGLRRDPSAVVVQPGQCRQRQTLA